MSNDLNLCQFIGRLGQDPEQKFLPSGAAVCNFSIAVGEQWKDKQSGERQERTEWVRITAFGKLAEICGQYLTKGSRIYASGRMVTRKWQAQDGTDRYSTEIKLDEMQMLDGRADGDQQRQSAPQQTQQTQQRPAPQQQRQSQPAQQDSWDDADNLVPF